MVDVGRSVIPWFTLKNGIKVLTLDQHPFVKEHYGSNSTNHLLNIGLENASGGLDPN